MWASLSAELLKLRRRPAMWLIAGVWLALSVVFGYLFPYLSFRGELSGAGSAGTPAELVLARGPGRLAVLAGKVGALGLVLLAVVLATFAVDAAASWLVAVATSHPVVDVLLRWTPATNAGSLAAALGVPVQGAPGGTPCITTMVDGTHATLVLAAYVVMFVAAAAALVQRRDVT